MTQKVNLAEKLDLFHEHWQPRIVARINDYDVRIVKVKGEFVWHEHDETDDFFLVLEGHLTVQLRDRDVELDAGELFVVPRGVEPLSPRRRRDVGPADRARQHGQHGRRG
jgi:mannose-6-phosphate isomerase-like protein (cupin superfamily)